MADRLAAGRHGGAPIQTHESNSNGPLLSLSLELFAVVLLHLPMRDLLLAQRVCKCFANVINGWPAIQQALYFRPAPTRTSSNDSVAPVINPLLRQQVTITSAPIVYTSSGGLRRPILVSVDFTNSSHNTTQLEDVPGSEAMSVTRPSIHLDDFTSTAQPAIFGVSETTQCHAQGSWRRMLATQPPCELDFTCTTDIQSSILAPLLERLSTGLVTLGNIWATECYAEVGRRSGQQLVQAVWAEEAQGGRLDNSIAQLSAWWWWDAGWIDGLLDIGTDGVGHDAPPETTNVALYAVLHTTELLEAMLLQISTRDLLLAQRVSQSFAELIDTSIRIQQALFFVRIFAKDAQDMVPTINPLLRRSRSLRSAPIISTGSNVVPKPLIISVDAIQTFYKTSNSDCDSPPNFEASISLI